MLIVQFQLFLNNRKSCGEPHNILRLGEINLISEIYLIFKGFTQRLKKDNVSAFSAQAAFFLFMSIMPFLSLLLTLVRYLPISQTMLYTTVIGVVPEPLKPMVEEILSELFAKNRGAYLSMSIILVIWAAAKGVMAIIRGLNSVYQVEDKRNYVKLRLISALYTVIIVAAIVISMLLLVFGNQIYYALKTDFPKAAGIISVFIKQKIVLSMLLLTMFFMFIYCLVKSAANNVLLIIPGAVFSALSWNLLSYAFSLYINYSKNFSYTYGSLATIVLFMLWMYFGMYLMFIGAEINSYFKVYFESVKKIIKHKKIVNAKENEEKLQSEHSITNSK